MSTSNREEVLRHTYKNGRSVAIYWLDDPEALGLFAGDSVLVRWEEVDGAVCASVAMTPGEAENLASLVTRSLERLGWVGWPQSLGRPVRLPGKATR